MRGAVFIPLHLILYIYIFLDLKCNQQGRISSLISHQILFLIMHNDKVNERDYLRKKIFWKLLQNFYDIHFFLEIHRKSFLNTKNFINLILFA